MPYDPSPAGREDALEIFVEGGRGVADRVYVLGRPRGGLVEVRLTEGALAPRELVESVDELRQTFDRVGHDRRRTSVDLELVRRWLDGRG